MTGGEKRKIKERYETENCFGTIEAPNVRTECKVVDFNRRAALLRGPYAPASGRLSFIKRDKSNVNHDDILDNIACSFLMKRSRTDPSTGESHHIAIFDNELTPTQFVKFNAIARATPSNNPALWELMLADKKEVKEELYQIERCRSDVFLTIATALFAVGAAVAIKQDSVSLAALTYASLLIALMFLLGISISIEKAQAINERRGFLDNLNEYIRIEAMPISYTTWGAMKYYFKNCKVLRQLEQCPLGLTVEKVSGKPSCRSYGKKNSAEFNKTQKIAPGPVANFMSLCSYTYCVLYVSSIALLTYVLIKNMEMYLIEHVYETEFSFWNEVWLFGTVFIAGLASFPLIIRFKKVLLTLIIAGIMIPWILFQFSKPHIDGGNYMFPATIVVAVAGLGMGSVGAVILTSLVDLRKGARSQSCYYYSWKKAIESCIPFSCLNPNKEYRPKTWLQERCLEFNEFFWGTERRESIRDE